MSATAASPRAATTASLADTNAGLADVQHCADCPKPLVGLRRGKLVRRSYPCVPRRPVDSTGVEPRLCETCWRRARYHDLKDTYRSQVRDKQRRWHEKRTKGARGATKAARGNGRSAKRPSPAPAVQPPTRPAPTRRVSSAQRLLAGR